MTEQPHTDTEKLAHRIAWRYKKSSDPSHSDTYTFNRETLLQFANALMADPNLNDDAADEIERLRGVLLWALWHHQSAGSPVGQPIRRVLGMVDGEAMTAVLTRKASAAAASAMTPQI